MLERSTLMVLLPSLLFVACAYGGGADRGGGPEGLLPSVQARTIDGVVEFTLQVTNTTDSPMEIEFTSGQSFDFRVLDGDREIWRWSADRMFTQALRTEVLPPGETLTYTAEWRPGGNRTGEFTIVGSLTSRSHPVEQSARFRLP